MEQYNKIVLETPSGNIIIQPTEGNGYKAIKGENGELIVRLVSNGQEDKAKYFTKISAKEREKVKKWLDTQENAPVWPFLKIVRNAVKVVNYNYWIANIEPSIKDGKIYYSKGKDAGVGFSCEDWDKMAKEYAPERGSRLSNIYELFIWYTLRIADGLWTLEYVVRDSSSAGNYWNAPNSTHNMEKTGARECGGYSDGQGNTYKIVLTVEGGYILVGGTYRILGVYCPVANVGTSFFPDYPLDYSCGVVVLTK